MGKKHILLLLTLVMLALLSGVYVVGGIQAYSRFRQNSLADQEHCGGQTPVHICVYAPAAIFSAFYPYYVATQYPLFKVNYSSDSAQTLLINVSIVKFSQEETQTVSANGSTQTRAFIPPLQGQILRNLTADMNTSLHVQVTDTHNQTYYLNDIPLLLRSRWLMQWLVSNRLQIAAWVTPNDPAVAELARKATAHLASEAPLAPPGMIGYKGSAQQVTAQVDAIYDSLRLDYGITYIQASVPYNGTAGDTSNDSAGGDNVTQYVKLPAEVLQQRSGMCTELTILLAAAVERIGLHASIVIIPGHAFLGVAVTEDNKHIQYWDAVDVNNNVAADSANVAANALYEKNLKQRTIVDTIAIQEARAARIGPMV
jgi:hypothetical protein